MKKLFTLLFCVVATGIAANANELPLVDKCINVVLGVEQPTTLMATYLDADHDGVISIHDVTTLIDQANMEDQVNHAPARNMDVEALINEVLTTTDGNPNINDVNKAIDNKLKNQK